MASLSALPGALARSLKSTAMIRTPLRVAMALPRAKLGAVGMCGASTRAMSARAAFHGGKMAGVDRMAKDEGGKAKALARCNIPPIELSERQACDVELLCTGAFSPLEGFMNEDVWTAVLKDMRLPGSNTLFGLPKVVMDTWRGDVTPGKSVVMDTSRADVTPGKSVALNFQGETLAVMDIESAWLPNKPFECQQSYGFTTLEHPGCRMIAMERAHRYIGGPITGLATYAPHRKF
ncbi:PUA-like domain-containing protein [Baffinella frigidus]|nr:PUA-like domain-containing protein [Cryptophyta sp. CCMP2293]